MSETVHNPMHDPEQLMHVDGRLGELAVSAEVLTRWKYDHDQLIETPIGGLRHAEDARQLVEAPGLADPDVAQVMATAFNGWHSEELNKKNLDRRRKAQLEAVPVTPQNQLTLAGHIAAIDARIEKPIELNDDRARTVMATGTTEAVADRERLAVETAITDRVEADRFPWTMPNPELPEDWTQAVRDIHESLVSPTEPKPEDVFKVAAPMDKSGIAEGAYYAPEDERLLDTAGVNDRLYITREALQKAGVFFVNRVGAGEQPIFGAPIPDPDSDTGFFDVQKRSLLTREEFEKVYDYQQREGFGIGDNDREDVQMDMLMFAVRPESRVDGEHKSSGFGSRENKYGQMRSPFVKSGFMVTMGVESMVASDEGSLRVNTTTIHLVDGHRDYPGVSEMFAEAEYDQRYMSAGEFVAKYYKDLPSREEAFTSLRYDLQTSRERAWVGPLPR